MSSSSDDLKDLYHLERELGSLRQAFERLVRKLEVTVQDCETKSTVRDHVEMKLENTKIQVPLKIRMELFFLKRIHKYLRI